MPHREGKDAHTSGKEARKLNKARKRGYISTGGVKSLTHYFLVPMGEGIHMVYNKKSSGLKYAMWDPHFALQTRAIDEGTYVADRDIGEMFLNFMLSKYVSPYFRVDINNMITEKEWGRCRLGGWGIWESKIMGLADSPYHRC